MEQTQEISEHTYDIGGVIYRLELQSWKQCKWLGQTIFKGVDVQTIDYATIHDCGREQAPLFMAITLLSEGQTRVEKSRMSWPAIEALAGDIEPHLTGWHVARFCTAFFFFCRPAETLMLIPGKRLQDELKKLAASAAPGQTGLSEPSSSSPMGTLPSSTGSVPNSDPLIQISSLSVDSNVAPSTTPYLDFAASPSHG